MDVTNYVHTILQKPHLEMSMETYGSKNLKLGFIPLTKQGMFLEVWPPGKLVGQLVFIKFGTVFYLDKSVVHAGGFTPGGDEALRLRFVFSERALDIEHFQIKSGEECLHDVQQIIDDAQVRTEFITTIED